MAALLTIVVLVGIMSPVLIDAWKEAHREED
jgi:hypothetical protein